MNQPPANPFANPGATRRPSRSTDWIKVTLMGSLLAGLLFVTVFWKPAGDVTDVTVPMIVEDATPPPVLDRAILSEARDGTRPERLVTEPAPLHHLLQASLQVTPAIAAKLGMPAEPRPIRELRLHPERHRGDYLWYKGRLEYLSPPKAGHPVPQYDYYEGRLVTEADETVVFAFSVPPPEDLAIGDWVRMEGFFLKLRDAHLPTPLDLAPMLVGPELFEAYADWDAIERLDPAVLARVRDGQWVKEGKFIDNEDMHKLLSESQDVPLWHLASYAIRQAEVMSPADWQAVEPFVTADQFEKFRHGEIAKGTPIRLLGTFVQARIMPAHINPLGLTNWTEVWLQVRDLGGKTIPVWIPKQIAADWKRNQAAVVRAHFFKRYSYTTIKGEDIRWTPLFVAADLDHYELTGDALSNPITLSFMGLIGTLGVLLFFFARRDRSQRLRHEAELVARRQKRRAENRDEHQQPCTS